MAKIHEGAKLIGELEFANGYRNQLWLSYNHNTGAPIVWQRVKSPTGKWTDFKRSTGRNISKMVAEMNMLLGNGIAQWAIVDEVCLEAFHKAA
jgi:hypothetical protein